MNNEFKNRSGMIIESEFMYNGYKCMVVFYDMGHRCGYVAVPKEQPIEDIYGFDVHGGITYDEIIEDQLVLGFDCAHLGDARDEQALMEYFGEELPPYVTNSSGVVRTLKYCIDECKRLVEQL